ncbi:hypothetical protein [Deinococcus aquaticus]|uniref:Uncharacterized protein n=1 Tax=Deinococcus aquaticus TaxID=328692 RepID=A0ABY7V2G5_9DEIO|nr:hypothetical protein [Deinococcus aquaticus]WDA58151.1 hypothetical protein M8445_12445 [Deinococcus aquaticus]
MKVFIINNGIIKKNENGSGGVLVNSQAIQGLKYPLTRDASKVIVAIALKSDGLVARMTSFELATLAGLTLNAAAIAVNELERNSMLMVVSGWL